jgi:hypothetical protein
MEEKKTHAVCYYTIFMDKRFMRINSETDKIREQIILAMLEEFPADQKED